MNNNTKAKWNRKSKKDRQAEARQPRKSTAPKVGHWNKEPRPHA